MNKLCVGDKLQIECYKHNGKVHRFWNEAIFLEKKDNYMVFANNNTLVIESNGTKWQTKEPAIMYFFDDEWFNIIVQLKKDGIYYYCNIATPYIIEDKTIKYIDYDLDLRIFPNGEYKILDKQEYKYHKKIMNYSSELDEVIQRAMKRLIYIYSQKSIMFDETKNMNYYNLYLKTKNDKLNKCC